MDDTRRRPPPTADEKTVITGWLDWQRATVRIKCTGLSEQAARRSLISTSPDLTVAGLVNHLTWVERGWLVRSFLGEDSAEQPDTWHTDRSLSALLDQYDAQCRESRKIIAEHDLDELERFAPPGLPVVSLRWIVGHLVEETARHLGHLDLLVELLDGRRGS